MKDAQITLIGLGLMGGSLAMRLKANQICRSVVALVRRQEAVKEAEQLGIVDWATLDPTNALQDADIVVFVTPVRVLTAQLQNFANFYKSGAIITDMGSTKQDITAAMSKLPPHVHPVGSHPMCGKEVAGLAAAEANLYDGATWVISPLPRTPTGAIKIIRELAVAVGSKPVILAPDRHDKLTATISHVPYLVSAAIVLAAQIVAEEDELVWEVAASGFRDTSRIAASDVKMMMDILLTNQDAVTHVLTHIQQQLNALGKAVVAADEDALRTMLEKAAAQRRALYL